MAKKRNQAAIPETPSPEPKGMSPEERALALPPGYSEKDRGFYLAQLRARNNMGVSLRVNPEKYEEVTGRPPSLDSLQIWYHLPSSGPRAGD